MVAAAFANLAAISASFFTCSGSEHSGGVPPDHFAV